MNKTLVLLIVVSCRYIYHHIHPLPSFCNRTFPNIRHSPEGSLIRARGITFRNTSERQRGARAHIFLNISLSRSLSLFCNKITYTCRGGGEYNAVCGFRLCETTLRLLIGWRVCILHISTHILSSPSSHTYHYTHTHTYEPKKRRKNKTNGRSQRARQRSVRKCSLSLSSLYSIITIITTLSSGGDGREEKFQLRPLVNELRPSLTQNTEYTRNTEENHCALLRARAHAYTHSLRGLIRRCAAVYICVYVLFTVGRGFQGGQSEFSSL